MNKYLTDMIGAGLEVNWLSVLIGLDGPAKYAPLLTLDDVEGFAANELDSNPCAGDAALGVLLAVEDGREAAREALQKLAETQRLDARRELRKWRVVLLKEQLNELPSDPLYGFLALTEFWERLDLPADAPDVVQRLGSFISPSERHSEEGFRAYVQIHQHWLEVEIAALRSSA